MDTNIILGLSFLVCSYVHAMDDTMQKYNIELAEYNKKIEAIRNQRQDDLVNAIVYGKGEASIRSLVAQRADIHKENADGISPLKLVQVLKDKSLEQILISASKGDFVKTSAEHHVKKPIKPGSNNSTSKKPWAPEDL